MRIPSIRTRRDMETAAELRAQGATWETVAQQLHRQPTVVIRWAKHYPEEWERLLKAAEERFSREGSNESRSTLRILLRDEDSKVRLSAADKLARQRFEEKASEPPPKPQADLSAFVAEVQEMSDDELEQCIDEYVRIRRGNAPA